VELEYKERRMKIEIEVYLQATRRRRIMIAAMVIAAPMNTHSPFA